MVARVTPPCRQARGEPALWRVAQQNSSTNLPWRGGEGQARRARLIDGSGGQHLKQTRMFWVSACPRRSASLEQGEVFLFQRDHDGESRMTLYGAIPYAANQINHPSATGMVHGNGERECGDGGLCKRRRCKKIGHLWPSFPIMPLLCGLGSACSEPPQARMLIETIPCIPWNSFAAGELCGARHLKLAENLAVFPPEILSLWGDPGGAGSHRQPAEHLPDALAEFSKLRILFCSENNFTRTARVLGRCPALTMVGFKANRIATVPATSPARQIALADLTDNADWNDCRASWGSAIDLQS